MNGSANAFARAALVRQGYWDRTGAIDLLPYAWRLSRYEVALRGGDAEYESWTDISAVGKSFKGITLREAEYLRVEDLYVDAVMTLSAAASSQVFEIVYLEHQEEVDARALLIPRIGAPPSQPTCVHRCPGADCRGLIRRNCAAGRPGEKMLIALLAVLGVDLIVIVVLLAFGLSRRRWVSHQPGAFRGAIRIADGEIDGLGSKWSRGYGRWVRDVLVWTKAPFLFRNAILATDGLDGQRPARPDEVKRLGEDPVVVEVKMGAATAEIAAAKADRELVAGPYRGSAEPRAVAQAQVASTID